MSCKPGTINLNVDVQGHRGCAGIMPENSISGFIHALELGVRTLELDIVMNADEELVVSHEPWISNEYCSGPDGEHFLGRPNIYRMTRDEIEHYDCGSGHNPKFPDQHKLPSAKPNLEDVVEAVKEDGRFDMDRITWNIEIKYRTEWVGIFCPERERYLDRFYHEVHALGIAHRSILQCFDAELLRMARMKKETIPLSYLVENGRSFEYNLQELGFNPEFYSPAYHFASSGMVDAAHTMGIRVLAWTVDREASMKKMMSFGVDGIITNYPDRLMGLLAKLKEENLRYED